MQRTPRTQESYFNVPESITLLNIVKSDQIQSAFQSNRKNHASVWEMVAAMLGRCNDKKRSAKQCCNRYENLKKIYTQLKRNPEKHVRRNWPYMYLFREIEEQRGECWGSNSKRNKSESYLLTRRCLTIKSKDFQSDRKNQNELAGGVGGADADADADADVDGGGGGGGGVGCGGGGGDPDLLANVSATEMEGGFDNGGRASDGGGGCDGNPTANRIGMGNCDIGDIGIGFGEAASARDSSAFGSTYNPNISENGRNRFNMAGKIREEIAKINRNEVSSANMNAVSNDGSINVASNLNFSFGTVMPTTIVNSSHHHHLSDNSYDHLNSIKEELPDPDYDSNADNSYGHHDMYNYCSNDNERNILHPDVIVDTEHVSEPSRLPKGNKRKLSTSTVVESTHSESMEYIMNFLIRNDEKQDRLVERLSQLADYFERAVVAMERVATRHCCIHNCK